MGGGGGGGNYDFPAYMKTWHKRYLDDIYPIMREVANTNPALNIEFPDASLYFGDGPARSFFDLLDSFFLFDVDTEWNKTYENIVNATVAKTAVKVFSDSLDEEYQEKALPNLVAGMRDINAVMSTQFVIGKAVLEATRLRAIAKFATDLQISLLTIAKDLVALKADKFKQVVHYTLEGSRLNLGYETERIKNKFDMDMQAIEWKLDSYDHGAKMLSAITGNGFMKPKRMSPMASMLSGAASGASMGASAGPYGAVGGGVVGAIGGYFSSK